MQEPYFSRFDGYPDPERDEARRRCRSKGYDFTKYTDEGLAEAISEAMGKVADYCEEE